MIGGAGIPRKEHEKKRNKKQLGCSNKKLIRNRIILGFISITDLCSRKKGNIHLYFINNFIHFL